MVRRMNHDRYCDIAVASPAPRMPMFIFCMKRASRKISGSSRSEKQCNSKHYFILKKALSFSKT